MSKHSGWPVIVTFTASEAERVLTLAQGSAEDYPPEYGSPDAATDDTIAAAIQRALADRGKDE